MTLWDLHALLTSFVIVDQDKQHVYCIIVWLLVEDILEVATPDIYWSPTLRSTMPIVYQWIDSRYHSVVIRKSIVILCHDAIVKSGDDSSLGNTFRAVGA